MLDSALLAFVAGIVGGAMNALAGGGTFATLPALIALGLPSTAANATSNVALQPGAVAAAWGFRRDLGPIGGVGVGTLAAITFGGGIVGSALLIATPTALFDRIIPWLLLIAFVAIAAGKTAAAWLHARVRIGAPMLMAAQAVLGVYGGYFGGGVGIMTTATYGLLAGLPPHRLMAPRTTMLATANTAAAILFIAAGLVRWDVAIPMLAGATLGGWAGAQLGGRLPPAAIRWWTLAMTGATTLVFFARAYG